MKCIGQQLSRNPDTIRAHFKRQNLMATIIITAEIDLPPERLEEALNAGKPLIEGALTQDGCLDYDWCPNPLVPGRIRVFERWRDEASLANHFNNRWYTDMAATIGSFGVKGAVSAKYRCDAEEPVYDNAGTPRADFVSLKGANAPRNR